MDPVTAWIIVVVVGVVLLALAAVLVRRWNRENRAKYPERFSGPRRFLEINRAPRR
jgi:heme/copper-type cytochrome/quinol oxidase subunit 2